MIQKADINFELKVLGREKTEAFWGARELKKIISLPLPLQLIVGISTL